MDIYEKLYGGVIMDVTNVEEAKIAEAQPKHREKEENTYRNQHNMSYHCVY